MRALGNSSDPNPSDRYRESGSRKYNRPVDWVCWHFENSGPFFHGQIMGGPLPVRSARSIRSRHRLPAYTCGESAVWNNTQNDNGLEWEGERPNGAISSVERFCTVIGRIRFLYISDPVRKGAEDYFLRKETMPL